MADLLAGRVTHTQIRRENIILHLGSYLYMHLEMPHRIAHRNVLII